MRIVAAVSIIHFSFISRYEAKRISQAALDVQDDKHDIQDESSVDNQYIAALLMEVMKLVKGFVDLKPLRIELGDFTCKQNKGVTSEIYHGKDLKYNSNIIDVECNTHGIHVGQPAHWHEDSDFNRDTLLEIDNLGLHLQCDTNVFSEYVNFLASPMIQGIVQKFGLANKTEEEEAVWTGRALCDIKKLEIENPKIYVESLQPGTLLKRKKSNVERFQELALQQFGPKEVEDEAPKGVEDEAPTLGDEKPAAREGNPLITFNSIQMGSCKENPYSKTGTYAETQLEGFCGFLLLRLELDLDGFKVVWSQRDTKLVAKLLSMSKKYTLSNFLFYVLEHIGVILQKGANAVNGFRRKLDQVVETGQKILSVLTKNDKK